MSSRKPGYLIGVTLLAVVLSFPHVFIGFAVVTHVWRTGSLFPLHGLGTVTFGGTNISHSPFWKNRFVYLEVIRYGADGNLEWAVRASDPETGEVTNLDLTLTRPNASRFTTTICGDRLFIYNVIGPDEVFEVVDDVLQPSSIAKPLRGSFVWKGELAAIEASKTAFALSTLKEGSWQKVGDIVLPEPDPPKELIAARKGYFCRGIMQFYSRDDHVHLFLNLDGRCYYRDGIEVKPASAASDDALLPKSASDNASENSTSSPSGSGSEGDLAGWTLVRSSDSPISWNTKYYVSSRSFMPMFVEGQPAALIVDGLSSGEPIGHIYIFDGATWTEFASQRFSMGSGDFRTVIRGDGLRSYIVVSTTTGSTSVYAVDAKGIRKTKGGSETPIHAMRSLGALLWYPSGATIWAILFGLGTWGLMWWFTKPDYEFGVQSVKLASLGWRAIARLIDLAFIGLTTASWGWLMMHEIDWLTPLEAFNFKIDHPTLHTVFRVAVVLGIWIVFVMVMMIATQALWGLTPGKWLCRLRTVQTSLRPCGFARSLAREIVFFVDSGYLFYWVPGILSIALIDGRQRLGDLVADTIVVEARSLAPASHAQ